MKIMTEFDSKKLTVKYLVDGIEDKLSLSLLNVDKNATVEQITQVIEAIQGLLNGNIQSIYVTEVSVGAIETTTNN